MKKKPILYVILIAVLASAAYAIYMYNLPKRDFDSEEAKFTITAVELVNELKQDFDTTRKKYYEQVIQFEGIVSEIEQKEDSIVKIFVYMKPSDDYDMITEMLPKYHEGAMKLKKGDKVTLKAKFTGAIEPDEMFEEDGSILFFGGSIVK